MAKPREYYFTKLADHQPTFRVSVTQPDGALMSVGTVRYFYIRHMKQHGWEATGPDGHLAVHEHRWQAAWALTWDRQGYPFPLVSSRQRDMVMIEN